MANIIDRYKPRAGEERDVVAPWLLAAQVAVVKLMAGAAGEVLMIGQANDRRCAGDYREAQRLALTVTASSTSAEAFLQFAGVEAVELLRPYLDVLRALTGELVKQREFDGAEVDRIISAALVALDRDRELRRQDDWRRVTQSAAAFPGVGEATATTSASCGAI